MAQIVLTASVSITSCIVQYWAYLLPCAVKLCLTPWMVVIEAVLVDVFVDHALDHVISDA
jgi:hypothetical protein